MAISIVKICEPTYKPLTSTCNLHRCGRSSCKVEAGRCGRLSHTTSQVSAMHPDYNSSNCTV